MIEINPDAYKPQTDHGVLVEKALVLLNKHAIKNGSGIISFKECRRVWGWLFHLSRDQTNQFLFELRNLGLIDIVSFHGVIIRPKEGKRK